MSHLQKDARIVQKNLYCVLFIGWPTDLGSHPYCFEENPRLCQWDKANVCHAYKISVQNRLDILFCVFIASNSKDKAKRKACVNECLSHLLFIVASQNSPSSSSFLMQRAKFADFVCAIEDTWTSFPFKLSHKSHSRLKSRNVMEKQ